MNIHIREGDIHLLDIQTRMPFKYGIATMTSTPHAFVRLRVEIDGKLSTGIAADHLPPKWFTKDPGRAIADEVAEMLRVIDHAVRTAVGMRGESPYAVWRQVLEAQSGWGKEQNLPPLLTQFGASLVERALIEAACRAAGRCFQDLLHADAFGLRLGDFLWTLADHPPRVYLGSPRPADAPLAVRHTVGLADPLTDAEIPPEERLNDGLPQSLTACIRAYGLRFFKIKVNGDLDRDRERLRRVAAIFREHVADPLRERYRLSAADLSEKDIDYLVTTGAGITLDGNEQFHDLGDFRAFWRAVQSDAELQPFLRHLVFVEQPLHRAVALDPAVARLSEWPDRPPIIIDESDSELDSLTRALKLGYAGTSHKNCKGLFKSIANACMLDVYRRVDVARMLRMSGEDLANIGPVALLQDLAVCAALGLNGVERNGHHYFAGLSMFPVGVQGQVLAAHGDLYHPSRDGWPTLAIRDGAVPMRSVIEAPFGVGFELDVEQFTPIEKYR